MSGDEVMFDEGFEIFFISDFFLKVELNFADVGVGPGVCSPAIELDLLLKILLTAVGSHLCCALILSHGNYKKNNLRQCRHPTLKYNYYIVLPVFVGREVSLSRPALGQVFVLPVTFFSRSSF